MSTAWQSFVARAAEGEPDEPFVRLLKQRLGSGYTVVRVDLAQVSRAAAYVLTLSYLRQLSKMEVPHTPSFTRWSLANGVRMTSREDEEKRWSLVAGDRFEAVESDFQAGYAGQVLLERLRALSPPRTAAALGQMRAGESTSGREHERAVRAVDGFLGGLVGDVCGALRYTAEEAGEIIDGALEGLAPDLRGKAAGAPLPRQFRSLRARSIRNRFG